MKQVILVRHAKSEKGFTGIDDFDRPLNERGCRDANHMADFIKQKNISVQAFVTSPGVRAISTAVIFMKALKSDWTKLLVKENLYESSSEAYLNVLSNINEEYNTVMLFGHNPMMNETYTRLTGDDIENIPTTGVCCIQFNSANWPGLMETRGSVQFFEYPKNLEKQE